MDDSITNDLKQQYQSLPKELQQAIADINLPAKLSTIVKNNKLMIDQAGILETETTLVLFGLEPLENYVDNLARELGMPKDRALTIAKDADELIFKGIRDALRQVNEEMTEAENAEVAQTEGHPSKEDILAGIEKPHEITTRENSVSVSSLPSNNNGVQGTAPVVTSKIEMQKPLVPEMRPEEISLGTVIKKPQPASPIPASVSPLKNIVETKMTETVALPKKTVVIEEKTKLPQANAAKPADPYRESIS